MEDWQRNWIQLKYERLYEWTDCTVGLLSNLVAKGVLSQQQSKTISNTKSINPEAFATSQKLYETLGSIKGSYDPLMAALKGTIQTGAYDILAEGKALHEKALQNKAQAEATELLSALDFVRSKKELEVIVNEAPCQEAGDYPLKLNGKRYALILNVIEFINLKKRRGAEKDTEYMTDLWGGLGYKLFPQDERKQFQSIPFLSKEDIQREITKFRNKCTEDQPEIVVVFIGSHGTRDAIESSRSESVNIYDDIVYPFSSENCPVLDGRPKVFIIQSCQNLPYDSFSLGERGKLPPKISDTVIIKPQVPGFESKRDWYKGSWFALVVTLVFMKFACNTSLQDMMMKVKDLIQKIDKDKNASDWAQMPTTEDMGMKTLYFVPQSRDFRIF